MPYNYYDSRNGILGARIDKAWLDYKNHAESDTQRETAFLFLLDIFHLDLNLASTQSAEAYLANQDKLNDQLAERMALRDALKDKHPEFIPSLFPAYLFDERQEVDSELIKKLTQGNTTILMNSDRDEIEEASAFTDAERARVSELIQNKEILAIPKRYHESDKTFASYYDSVKRAHQRLRIKNGRFYQGALPFDGTQVTSHFKPGFCAFTFNLNGEISYFNHRGGVADPITQESLVHSSMNSGNPVICAGELQIDEQGKLVGITAHSGHYQPTLFNIYRFLQHLESQGMDVSDVNIYLSSNRPVLGVTPQKTDVDILFPGTSAPQPEKTSFIKADVLMGRMRTLLTACMKEASAYHGMRQTHLSHWWTRLFLNSNLTEERIQKIVDLMDEFQQFSATAFSSTSGREEKIDELVEKIDQFKRENMDLSEKYGEKRTSGKLTAKLESMKQELQALKLELRNAEKEEEVVSNLKMRH